MPNVTIRDLPPVIVPIDAPSTFLEVSVLEAGVEVSRKVAADDLQTAFGLDATFVTVTANAILPNERILTAGSGIDIVDSGAGLAVTIDISAANLLPAGTVTDSSLRWGGAAWFEETQIRISAAGVLTIFDSGLTDSGTFAHDGTDFNTAFINTTDWNITGLSDLITSSNITVQGSGGAPATNESRLTQQALFHDGKEALLGSDTFLRLNNSGDFTGGTFTPNPMRIDSSLRVGTSTDFGLFSHDGTDFNTAFTLTADWNITGATNYKFDDSLFITEKAAANTDVATLGQLWVRSDTPNTMMFTDDAGTDFIIGGAISAAYTRNATIVEDRTLLASASATTLNNNNVLAALIADLQTRGILG